MYRGRSGWTPTYAMKNHWLKVLRTFEELRLSGDAGPIMCGENRRELCKLGIFKRDSEPT
jgi:hypothetical protein